MTLAVEEKIVDITDRWVYVDWDRFCIETLNQARSALSRSVYDNLLAELYREILTILVKSKRITKYLSFAMSVIILITNIKLFIAGVLIAALAVIIVGSIRVIARRNNAYKEMIMSMKTILQSNRTIFNQLQPGLKESNQRHLKILFMKCVYDIIDKLFHIQSIILTDENRTICHYCHVLGQNPFAWNHHTFNCLDRANQLSTEPIDKQIYFKGKFFLNDTSDIASETDKTPISLSSNSNICSICLDRTSNIVFIPCGHVTTCTICSTPLTTCVLCRCIIVKRQRLYFS